jgi:hypothetical protein
VFIGGLDLKLRARLASASGPFNGHATLGSSLESYWALDEASGVRVDSVVATANDLTDNNTVASTTGVHNLAGQFVQGNTERLTHIDSSSLRVGVADFTFAFWYRRDADTGNNTAPLAKGTQQDYTFDTNPNSNTGIRFYTSNGGGFPIAAWGSALTLGTWYYIVGWRNGAAQTLNIQVNNGTAVSAATGAIVDGDTATAFSIGAFGSGASATTSSIDEVGFWKRVLTAQERTDLYNGGTGLFYS